MSTLPQSTRTSADSSENLENEQQESIDKNEGHENPDVKFDMGVKEGIDDTIETSGEVAEVMSDATGEDRSGGGPKTKAKTKASNIAEIKAKLLERMPNEAVMKKQITNEIKKEVKYLHNKAMGIFSPKNLTPFEMSNLMRRVRELKGLLFTLLKMSVDNLKTLWLRFVHGIM